jgi:hypothetical protein
MSKAAVPPTKDALLKSYQKRLKDDISSITTNFTEIIKLCKVEDENQACAVVCRGRFLNQFHVENLQVANRPVFLNKFLHETADKFVGNRLKNFVQYTIDSNLKTNLRERRQICGQSPREPTNLSALSRPKRPKKLA